MLYNSYKEYRSIWNNAHNSRPPIPLNLDIELSTVCNLRCPFCFFPTDKFKQLKRKSFMNTTVALYLIGECSKFGIPAVKFNWRGESTLHPQFNEIMKYAKENGGFYDILINTNGNVDNEKIAGLMYATKVMVSLDTYGKNEYAEMRKGGDLRVAVQLINELLARGHKNVWVRRVINEKNKNEDFVTITKSIFGNKVHIAEHYCFDRQKEMKQKWERIYCGYPSQRLVVSTDGDIYPCCVDYYETMKLGNIHDNNLRTVWMGEKINDLIARLKQNYPYYNTACMTCTSYKAYKRPERELVDDKDLK